MFKFDIEQIQNKWNEPQENMERIILSEGNKILDICEFEKGEDSCYWTREELMDIMKEENNVEGDIPVAVCAN